MKDLKFIRGASATGAPYILGSEDEGGDDDENDGVELNAG
jgi:hypothetical protein